MVLYLLLVIVGVLLFHPAARLFEQWDAARSRWITSIRTGWLTQIMLAVNALTSRWTIRILRWGTIVGLIAFRRWRHLLVFVGCVIALEVIAFQLSVVISRPRPLGVKILAGWRGFSMPSRPLAGLAVSLVGLAFALLPHGRLRDGAKWAIGGVLALTMFARVYLAVDQPTSAGFGAVLGVAVALIAFRWFTPNDVFPVSYRKRQGGPPGRGRAPRRGDRAGPCATSSASRS